MIESLLPLTVGMGLVVGLLFSEFFGLAAGGMVVPGYIALYLTRPIGVALTLSAGLITFFIVEAISSVTIVYGRRRTSITILLGYLVGMSIRWLSGGLALSASYDVIGFIIPGLIAIWIARQGVVETFCSILVVSIMVRLLLIIFLGEALI